MTHGEIWTIDFGQPVGSLPSKIRPVVVMQNDLLGIKDLNTVVVIPCYVYNASGGVLLSIELWKKRIKLFYQ